ncbi:MAG: 23S rRNA (uracil1939-C5)-methyltransferase [Planctomycetota bacterium]
MDRLDRRGPGLGWVTVEPWGQFRVVLRHTPPGRRVLAEVLKRRGTKLECRVVEVLDPGPHGAESRCRHYGMCGGCSWQAVDYGAQLHALEVRVRETLEENGVLGEAEVRAVEGMPDPWGYRNKMDFTFAARRWVEPQEPEGAECAFALGLHAPGRHEKAIDIHECYIAFPEAAAIVGTVRERARALGLEPWDLRDHTGLLRHLVLRKSFATGEVLAFLVTSSRDAERIDPFVAEVLAAHPEIATLVQGVHDRPASVAACDEEHILHGSGTITERLAGLEFELSPQSFFQTNTQQAERLVEVVREELDLQPGATLYDLYSGAGTLGLCVVDPKAKLLGFESVPSAVADARRNAQRNGVPGATFVEGDVLATLAENTAGLPAPDALVVDPPRAGLHPKVVPAIGALGAPRIVYVSCNVESAAKDLAVLAECGYQLVRARPLDLFPHTPHLECVLTLELKS